MLNDENGKYGVDEPPAREQKEIRQHKIFHEPPDFHIDIDPDLHIRGALGDAHKIELFALEPQAHVVALLDLLPEQRFGERRADPLVDRAAQRARSECGIVSELCDLRDRRRIEFQERSPVP